MVAEKRGICCYFFTGSVSIEEKKISSKQQNKNKMHTFTLGGWIFLLLLALEHTYAHGTVTNAGNFRFHIGLVACLVQGSLNFYVTFNSYWS